MKTSELFRKTLKAYIDKQGHGAQARLADELGMDRNNFNGFLNGRKMISESKREEIAEKLGYSYVDFLILGREMFKEKPDKKELSIPEDNFSIILLGRSIEYFENLKLTSELKAKLAILIYDFLSKDAENTYKYKPKKIDIDTFVEVIETFDVLDKKSIALFGEDDFSYKWLRQDRAFMIASCCMLPEGLDAVKDAIKNLDKEIPASKIIEFKSFLNEKLKQAA